MSTWPVHIAQISDLHVKAQGSLAYGRVDTAGALERYTHLTDDARQVWLDTCVIRSLTGRGAARVRRVARTIADLDDSIEIEADHVDRAAWMREDLW